MTATQAPIPTFERMLDLEHDARICVAINTFQVNSEPMYRRVERNAHLANVRRELFALMDGLSAEELAAFGTYRATES